MSREALLRRITSQSRVTFRDAMDAALNDAGEGWYGAGRASIGTGGDFTTSAELSPLFGACVATWVAERCERNGESDALEIVEFGAGKGSLARSVLHTLSVEYPGLYERVNYTLVEKSPTMRERANDAVHEHAACASVVESIEAAGIPAGALVVSNEFVDALPVHVVRHAGGGVFEELYLEAGPEGRLARVWDSPSSTRIAKFADLFVPAVSLGLPFVFEAALDAWDWIDALTRHTDVSAVLTFDYGDAAVRVAGPHRPAGTIRAMRGRQPVADIVESLSSADLTADVNFTVLSATAEASGWTAGPLVTQEEWLLERGAAERISRAATAPIPERLAMKALLAPAGLGERMRVLELSRQSRIL